LAPGLLLINIYGDKKESLRKIAVQGLQESELLYLKVQEDGRGEVGNEQVLQNLQEAYFAQGK
jgi:hypothetical protein